MVIGPPNLSTAPYAPSNLWATVTGSTVVLNWTAPTAASVTSYILEAGAQPGGSELANADIGPATTFTATNVPSGTYAVIAWHEGLSSDPRPVTVPDAGIAELEFTLR